MRKQNYTPETQQELLTKLAEHYGKDVLTSGEIEAYTKSNKLPYAHFIFHPKANFKVKWGQYRVRGEQTVDTSKPNLAAMVANVAPIGTAVQTALKRKVAEDSDEKFFAKKDPTYVPFGFYNDLKTIIQSKVFYPVYITGLSGNGKTVMVEQVLAVLAAQGRELIRVNITKETDEADLIGSFDLIDGNTVRNKGPVITAMERGAVLLLDEVDLGTERILCLQPILEGKPFFDKKTKTIIHPQPGFNIVATANTKGKGSDDGRFIGANVLNEALLERFAITVEQEYAPEKIEKNILLNNMDQLNIRDENFATCLVRWANMTRKSFQEEACDEIISTRRLVHIVKAYGIFKNKTKALTLCLNRFDDETKQSFLDAYSKVDTDLKNEEAEVVVEPATPAVDPAERLQQTVQSTVMPPATQRPAPVITPPPAPAPSPRVTPAPTWTPPPVASTPARTAMPSTGSMPSWASAAFIMKVTMGMAEPCPIEINYDPAQQYHTVTAYGVKAVVKPGIASTVQADGILKAVVDYCYQVKTVGAGLNPFA